MSRRPPLLDAALAAALLVGGAAQLLAAEHSLPVALDLVLAAFLTMPLAARRRWPVATLAVVCAAMLVGIVTEDASADLLFMPPLLIASYTVGSRVPLPRALVAPVAIAAIFAGGVATGSTPAGDVPVGLLLFTGPWFVGQLLRVRDRHVAELTARAVRAETQRDRDTAEAVAAERTRIARELHDVISHSISVITIQAQAVRRRLSPEQEAECADLTAIEVTARQAMVEMRRMLGVLRADGEPLMLSPQPGLDQLEQLVAEARTAGVDVHLEVRGERVPLPPGGDTAAYRIVQEALTNVRKHTRGASCTVLLEFVDDGLAITVTDDGGTERLPAQREHVGHGLIGMRERTMLFGGRLDASRRADAPGFRVRATLPVHEPVAT